MPHLNVEAGIALRFTVVVVLAAVVRVLRLSSLEKLYITSRSPPFKYFFLQKDIFVDDDDDGDRSY